MKVSDRGISFALIGGFVVSAVCAGVFIDRALTFWIFLGIAAAIPWFLYRRLFRQCIGKVIAAAAQLPTSEPLKSSCLFSIPEVEELNATLDRIRAEMQERRHVEEALRNSERRSRSIWENSLEPLRLTNREGIVLAANPAYCQMMGQDKSQVVGALFTAVYDPRTAEEKFLWYRDSFQNRSFQRHQARLTLACGQILDAEISYSFIDVEGDEPMLLALYRDVSERTAFIEKLNSAKEFSENVIKTANVMVVGIDLAGRITIFNEAAEQVSGFSKAEVEGTLWNDLIGDAEETAVRLGTAGHRSIFEATLRTKGGEFRTISWQSNAVFENGHPAGTICFGTDVTEKKQENEHRLALERKMLDAQKLESLGVLAGGIAHDFNNLLAAILGNANLAQMQLPPSESKLAPYLKNIEKTAMRAADLCKQMLAYSGKARFAPQALDINEVVRETLELLEVSITKKAALRVELRHGVPLVFADATQIRQVVMNLVINASESMGDKPGLIRVRTGNIQADAAYLQDAYADASLPPGEYAFIEVSDTGCGMSSETQKRIFEPFFTTKFTGRGLGLAAVLGIVRGHKGALKLKSVVNEGSSFRFLLPLAPTLTEPEPANFKIRTVDWKGEGTILVVDDDPTVRAVTSRIVESFGFNVLQAVDGRHGVEVFSDNSDSVTAVVLDMTMPNLNGREAFERMRAIRSDVKVLLVSGFSENCTTGSFANGGPKAFLQKPYKPDELKDKLRFVIQN